VPPVSLVVVAPPPEPSVEVEVPDRLAAVVVVVADPLPLLFPLAPAPAPRVVMDVKVDPPEVKVVVATDEPGEDWAPEVPGAPEVVEAGGDTLVAPEVGVWMLAVLVPPAPAAGAAQRAYGVSP